MCTFLANFTFDKVMNGQTDIKHEMDSGKKLMHEVMNWDENEDLSRMTAWYMEDEKKRWKKRKKICSQEVLDQQFLIDQILKTCFVWCVLEINIKTSN